jgi:hypothetical protein
MHQHLILLLSLLLCGECANAQIGQELEKIKARKNIIETSEKKKYGKKFVLVTTDEKMGIILEMWFLDGVCVSARWLDRTGEPTQDFKELVWKVNFGTENVVKKGERSWEGEGGYGIHWGKTKDGMNVMVVESKKMNDILLQEIRRQQGLKKEEDGVGISFEKQQIYSSGGEWSGTMRNGKIYGTDGTWQGNVRNGNLYGTDGTWGGRINSNGQIYNSDSEWKGSVR